MSFSKAQLKGTKQVFSFTFLSLLKNKANIIAVAVFLIAGLLAVPAAMLLGGRQISAAPGAPAAQVQIYNETDLQIDSSRLAQSDQDFAATGFKVMDDTAFSGDPRELSEDEAAAVITEGKGETYQIDLYTSAETEISSEDMSALESLLQEEVKTAQYQKAGLSDRQIQLLNAQYSTQIGTVSDVVNEDTQEQGSQYGIQLGYAIVVLIVSIMAVSYIIRTVVEEKASKLVEMLLMSVRPLALIAGKILAAMAYVFGIFILFLISLLISYGVSIRIFGLPGISELLEIVRQMGAGNIGPQIPVIMIISMILGCLTFAIIAGLSGAGCSTTEDISGASTTVMLLIMGGYFVAIMISNVPSRGLEIFSALCPVLSVFCGPVQYAMGNISAGMLILSWVIQGAVILLLALFCAKVYSSLIIYKGNRLKWTDMIGLARNKTGKGGVR